MGYSPRPLKFVGSARKDIGEFPREVQHEIGIALLDVQYGGKPDSAKPLHGFPGASVMQISESFKTDAYRAVYTVRFAKMVYVLHCFQKKSKRGAETPKEEMDVIEARLKSAQADYEKNYGGKE